MAAGQIRGGSKLPPDLSSVFLAITQHALSPMAMVEGAGHTVSYANPAFCRLMDKTAEHLVGKPFGEMLQERSGCVAMLNRVFRTGKPESHTEQKHSESDSVFRSYAMWPVIADDRPLGAVIHVTESAQFDEKILAMNQALMLGSVRQHELADAAENLNEQLRAEIHERKRAEESSARLAAIVESSDDAILSKDLDGFITSWNAGAERLFGYTAQEAIGQPVSLIIPADRADEDPGILKRILHGSRVENYETIRHRKDGSVLDVSLTVSPIVDREGKLVGASKIARDITARRALEKKLRQAQKMEVVGKLAGGVAHDYNNILAAIILRLEVLRMQHQWPAKAQSSLQELGTLATRAARLTRQLLLFSRQQAMHLERLEMNAVLGDLLNPILEDLLGGDIACIRLVSPGELWVEADASMLDHAVMTLCLNAKDAMPKGGTLTLEPDLAEFSVESAQSHPDSSPGRFVCLRITDTGCGMDADVLKHLFEPFFTTKDIGKGIGMGLASVYGIVRQHKGWVHVESVVGQGTSFRLYLPLSARTKEAHPATPELPPSVVQNKTILVVEDEADLLLISTEALTMLGYRVLGAADGHEALDLWEQHQSAVDLVLTDVRMPKGINGLELAETLLKSKPTLKIIIMSGYSMDIVKGGMPEGSSYTFLAKPFNLQGLADTVRNCLDQAAASALESISAPD